MLDVAWALFEVRMLHQPASDPNAVWTDITSRYLRVVPHPEYSWWAVRVQLMDSPGYMVNYGLGAVITADVRHRIRQSLGPFDSGDPRWHSWISEQLLRVGGEFETSDLLRRFLGRPVSPQALIDDLQRLAPSH
jgi:Zn-dependent M32 family carboxypeptidase